MDLRLSDVAPRQFPVEIHDDHRWPLPVKSNARPAVGKRRAKVIA
jgi:hypothetical protein